MKKFNPDSGAEIRGKLHCRGARSGLSSGPDILEENKLLAKLFHERQLRNRQGSYQDVQSASADAIDTSNQDAIVAECAGGCILFLHL